jgi:hypothetical protein
MFKKLRGRIYTPFLVTFTALITIHKWSAIVRLAHHVYIWLSSH